MKKAVWFFLVVILSILSATVIIAASEARTVRSRAPLLAFRKLEPCPATGKLEIYTPCPGYVIDHIMPLCAGGRDEPDNLQWQEYNLSKKKDLLEMELCRKLSKTCRK